MDAFENTIETMVNSFSDVDESMNFSATLGIQDSPIVRFRLFQLRNQEYADNFVNEMESLFHNLEDVVEITNGSSNLDLELALEFVRREEKIEEAMKAYLFDIEMEELTRVCTEDGEWNPRLPQNQSRPGPSNGLRYSIRKKSERTYAKNFAVDKAYEIKIDERYHGQSINDIQRGLKQLLETVLNEARGNLAGNDLVRVIIQHDGLDNTVVDPLQRWYQLDAAKVMEMIMEF